MKTSKLLARSIWVLSLLPGILRLSLIQQDPQSFGEQNEVNYALLLLPILFFSACGFLMPNYPFDVPPLRQILDRKFGANTYSNFMMELKPMLLLGITAIFDCILKIGINSHSHLPLLNHAAAFSASAGVGFLLIRTILAKRGVSMESPQTQAIWLNRQFIPNKILRIRATIITALLTGIWTGIGVVTSQAFLDVHKPDPQLQSMFFLGVAVIFFFIPVILFVFGIQNQALSTEKESILNMIGQRGGQTMIRMFFWIIGFLIGAKLVSAIISL